MYPTNPALALFASAIEYCAAKSKLKFLLGIVEKGAGFEEVYFVLDVQTLTGLYPN